MFVYALGRHVGYDNAKNKIEEEDPGWTKWNVEEEKVEMRIPLYEDPGQREPYDYEDIVCDRLRRENIRTGDVEYKLVKIP